MLEQIHFRGIIEYLNILLNIDKQIALDIASNMNMSNPEDIFKVDLNSYLLPEKIEELKNKLRSHSLYSFSFLLGLGFSSVTSEVIYKYFGKSDCLVNIIKENPYNLLSIEEITFKKIDKIALEFLNIPEDSEKRHKALVYYQLYNLSNKNGHLFIELEKFINSKFEVEIPIDTIKKYLKELILEKKIIFENKKLYISSNYKAEQESAKIIANLISKKRSNSFFEGINPDTFIKGYEEIQSNNLSNGKWKKLNWKSNEFKLSEKQKEAVRKFLVEKFFMITGLPGTGKTLNLKVLVDICKSRSLKVTLMTPTGISAKRLADICDYEASTIHKELEFDGIFWRKNEDNKLNSDVIIIDEFSMVDQVLLYRLLSALPDKDFILVFVGDDAQLPSVGPGNVLKELILNGKISHVRLTEIFRQEDASDIILNAHLINKGITSLVCNKQDFKFIDIEEENKILNTIIRFIHKLNGENFQILSPTYNGVLGVTNLNNTLQEIINPNYDGKFFKTESYTYKINDKIMIIKNDYKNEVYNGEQGEIVNINNRHKRIFIKIDNKNIDYSFKDAYSMISLDYARTIHKAQSQEYDYVIIPFVRDFNVQLQRNLLYTAVTRAKKKVFLIGHKEALYKAIKNNNISKRNTLFSSRIMSFLDTFKS